MDSSGGEIESRSWLARQILTRQLQTLISLHTEGEVEEERVEKLHDQLRKKCDGSSPADFSDFVDAGGIQFILSGLNNGEERIRSVCLRLLGSIGSAFPPHAAFTEPHLQDDHVSLIQDAMEREIRRAIGTDIEPHPTAATLAGLLQGIRQSSLWHSLVATYIPKENMISLLRGCFRDKSHVLQTNAVDLLVELVPRLEESTLALIKSEIFCDPYISLHPTIIPLLVESFLKSQTSKYILWQLQDDFSRILWNMAVSSDTLTSNRSRETIGLFISVGMESRLECGGSKVLDQIESALDYLLSQSTSKSHMSAVKFLPFCAGPQTMTWLEHQYLCLSTMLQHGNVPEGSPSWIKGLKLAPSALEDVLLSNLSAIFRIPQAFQLLCYQGSIINQLFQVFLSRDRARDRVFGLIECLAEQKTTLPFILASEASICDFLLCSINSSSLSMRDRHLGITTATKLLSRCRDSLSERKSHLILQSFLNQLDRKGQLFSWDVLETVLYSFAALGDIGSPGWVKIAEACSDVIEEVLDPKRPPPEEIVIAAFKAACTICRLTASEDIRFRILTASQACLSKLMSLEEPMIRREVLALFAELLCVNGTWETVKMSLDALGACLSDIYRMEDDYEICLMACKICLLVAKIDFSALQRLDGERIVEHYVRLPDCCCNLFAILQLNLVPQTHSTVRLLRITAEEVLAEIRHASSTEQLSLLLEGLSIRAIQRDAQEAETEQLQSDLYPLKASEQNEIDCAL